MGGRLSDVQIKILLLCLESRFLTCQDILHQVFVGREYNVAHASLSRSLTRLWGRGLIQYWTTLTHYSRGITLTAAGKALALTIMAEAAKEQIRG
jgi:DNA-binding MarR family transcriptional regulator